jgi:hypothetical protein
LPINITNDQWYQIQIDNSSYLLLLGVLGVLAVHLKRKSWQQIWYDIAFGCA